MIKIDDHRKANLEMMFQHAQDRDLIHELLRRGRLHQIEVHALFWPEMRDEPGYMEAIHRTVHRHLATAFADSNVKPTIIQEREYPVAALDEDFKLPSGNASGALGVNVERQSVLTADVIVLCQKPEKV